MLNTLIMAAASLVFVGFLAFLAWESYKEEKSTH